MALRVSHRRHRPLLHRHLPWWPLPAVVGFPFFPLALAGPALAAAQQLPNLLPTMLNNMMNLFNQLAHPPAPQTDGTGDDSALPPGQRQPPPSPPADHHKIDLTISKPNGPVDYHQAMEMMKQLRDLSPLVNGGDILVQDVARKLKAAADAIPPSSDSTTSAGKAITALQSSDRNISSSLASVKTSDDALVRKLKELAEDEEGDNKKINERVSHLDTAIRSGQYTEQELNTQANDLLNQSIKDTEALLAKQNKIAQDIAPAGPPSAQTPVVPQPQASPTAGTAPLPLQLRDNLDKREFSKREKALTNAGLAPGVDALVNKSTMFQGGINNISNFNATSLVSNLPGSTDEEKASSLIQRVSDALYAPPPPTTNAPAATSPPTATSVPAKSPRQVGAEYAFTKTVKQEIKWDADVGGLFLGESTEYTKLSEEDKNGVDAALRYYQSSGSTGNAPLDEIGRLLSPSPARFPAAP